MTGLHFIFGNVDIGRYNNNFIKLEYILVYNILYHFPCKEKFLDAKMLENITI